jgi:SAM-dependent methyltransferase
MEAKPIDAAEFREKQRDQWDGAAVGWNEWSEMIDKAAGGVSERLVEMADIKEGDRILDVAAGYGEPSLTAARKVGPEGSVVATDISSEMVGFGRELRRRRLALGNHLRPRWRGRGLAHPRSAEAGPPFRDQLMGSARAGAISSDRHADRDEEARRATTAAGHAGTALAAH